MKRLPNRLKLLLFSTLACDKETPDVGDPTSESSSASVTASESGAVDPCDNIEGGVIPDECAEWMADECLELADAACIAYEIRSTSAGELGCVVARRLDPDDQCQPGVSQCVPALHTGEGPQGDLWYIGQDVFETSCQDTALPCPALIVLGYSACGLEAESPEVCGCA